MCAPQHGNAPCPVYEGDGPVPESDEKPDLCQQPQNRGDATCTFMAGNSAAAEVTDSSVAISQAELDACVLLPACGRPGHHHLTLTLLQIDPSKAHYCDQTLKEGRGMIAHPNIAREFVQPQVEAGV